MAIRPDRTLAAVRDRAVGALLGLAVGDALGTTLEFTHRDQRPPLTDLVGGGAFGLAPGQWTDDTAMALALAESLAEHAELDPRDLMDRFVAWWRRGTYSCTGDCFDIGITTRAALASYERGGDPLAGPTDPMTAGNGSLMRVAPVAIRFSRNATTRSAAAALQSRTTHGAPEAVSACVVFTDLLAEAIAGEPIDQVLRPRPGVGRGAIAAIMAGSWQAKERDDIRSSGYVAHTLEAALWAVGRSAGFEDAVLLAANLGDDADTVAAVTGQLAGALWGASAIPERWLARLAWRERLEDAADRLVGA